MINCVNAELPPITEQFGEADDILLNRTLTNTRHVLQTCLPDRTETTYNLRNRSHNKALFNKTSHLNEKCFYTNASQRPYYLQFLDFLIFCVL